MSAYDMPPLPEPDWPADECDPFVHPDLFTADQIRERDAQWQQRLEAAVGEEREACAKVCEDQETYGDNVGSWFDLLADKIRARSQA